MSEHFKSCWRIWMKIAAREVRMYGDCLGTCNEFMGQIGLERLQKETWLRQRSSGLMKTLA
jgi:hypothetical protein